MAEIFYFKTYTIKNIEFHNTPYMLTCWMLLYRKTTKEFQYLFPAKRISTKIRQKNPKIGKTKSIRNRSIRRSFFMILQIRYLPLKLHLLIEIRYKFLRLQINFFVTFFANPHHLFFLLLLRSAVALAAVAIDLVVVKVEIVVEVHLGLDAWNVGHLESKRRRAVHLDVYHRSVVERQLTLAVDERARRRPVVVRVAELPDPLLQQPHVYRHPVSECAAPPGPQQSQPEHVPCPPASH